MVNVFGKIRGNFFILIKGFHIY